MHGWIGDGELVEMSFSPNLSRLLGFQNVQVSSEF